MVIGVPAETAAGERRVALVPETIAKLAKAGVTAIVERGAGTAASYTDEAYEAAGATLASGAADVFAKADFIAKVARPSDAELALMRPGQTLLAFLAPLGDPQSVEKYAAQKITALSMDAIPRTTRAQSMDALSSQANIGGYKAVLLAAAASPRFLPMLTTSAGTIKAQKVFVIGAGVAGLRAIATAKRLGATVSGYDTRAAVKEQVQSLGAAFVEIDLGISGEGTGGYARALSDEEQAAQQRILTRYIHTIDIVITTAAVPGRRAPVLVSEAAVRGMRPGSVIVDLAAETGGNCALTKPGETIDVGGVTIIGLFNLPSSMPSDASTLYSRNIAALLGVIVKDGALVLDESDEIVRGTTIVRDGTIVHEATNAALAGSRSVNYAHLLSELTIFVLAVFVGVEVISKVPPTLHTPLMSATNAIHGIVLVGALLIAVVAEPHLGPALSILAVFLASLNVFGGYVVTQRMLAMFKARPQAGGDAKGPVRDDLTIRLTEDWKP